SQFFLLLLPPGLNSSSLWSLFKMAPKNTLPDSYTARCGTMYFAAKKAGLEEDKNWTRLEAGETLPGSCNRSSTKKAYYSWEFQPHQYHCIDVKRGQREVDVLTIIFRRDQPPSVQFGGDESDVTQVPLAKRVIRIYKTRDRARETGFQRGVSRAESQAQEALLVPFKNCRIKTMAAPSNVTATIEVYPGPLSPQSADEKAVELDKDAVELTNDRKLGQSYFLFVPNLFTNDEKTLKSALNCTNPPWSFIVLEHPIIGAPYAGWELVVAKGTETSGAAIVGTIRNSFIETGITDFIDKEEFHVQLQPNLNDVQGARSRKAMGQLENMLDENSKAMHDFFVQPKQPMTRLPVDNLFIGRCLAAGNHFEGPAVDSDAAEVIRSHGLNPSQAEYFRLALGSKVSIAHGPPGTSKSIVLAALIHCLVANKGERIAATAMTHVAVDQLLERCVKAWQARNPNVPAPFLRLYSEAQIVAQWAAGDHECLQSPFHIDQRRYELACENEQQWSGYLGGREQLKTTGCLASKDAYDAYVKQARLLGQQLLDGPIHIVFCTIAASLSAQLFEVEKVDATVVWYFKATTIINDEAGTTLRPYLMLLLMAFRDAVRLSFAGDHLQLPPFIFSKLAKDL
ncbi:MAG: hypothetical protein Q9181_007682, partial [Wetmoreana brouardii]